MDRDVTIILGKTGYGKSVWSKLYLKKFSRQFVYDPMMSVETHYMPAEDMASDIMDNLETYQNPQTSFSLGVYDTEGVAIIGALSYAVKDNICLVEECSMVFDKGTRNLPEWARRIVFTGRHNRCSICLIAQRAVSIPIDFRSQANRVVCFQQHEGDDLAWLMDFYGRERVKEIPSLPRLECLDYCDGQVQRYSVRPLAEKHLGIRFNHEPSNSDYAALGVG